MSPLRTTSSKPLAELTARDGTRRPLVEWTWRAACAAVGSSQVLVATDCEAIAARVESFGGRAVMTSPELRNGTERCAAVLQRLDREPALIVNLQGDSPLVPPHVIHALIGKFSDPHVSVATPCAVCDKTMAMRILDDMAQGRVGGTCVVTSAEGCALYFSKYPIPHGASEDAPLKLHLGVYAYRPAALRAYAARQPSSAERAEGLEQLRFLDAGWPVHVAEVELPDSGIWEVNNPEDVALVEALLPFGGALQAVPTQDARK